ncbi:cyclic-di-AMP-binding protein CbpB [Virgibacillus alimentarius]|uniref:Transcriptional regulator n=1 Tax=Virgibacillus alimentarius TaxID=698769 RepID=A0ABS4S604_9BACI|nr:MULTISPECIES: cyclic-di-AMP-binding protein CbpB [Virgibacillus]MBP2256926.1 putative transcriptional regulator [Virgibacillus alimentarius]HLR68084.1 cyclic-di-AMP-binding protein CbpB [Virgibacillus sp.]
MSMLQDKQATNKQVVDLMIPSEKVAHVQLNNPLEHALLVLVKSGYSAVPVLDTSYKLVGTIGKTAILNQTLGLERFEFEQLSDMRVHEIMKRDIPRLTKEDTYVQALKTVINSPFVCVADQEGYFDGIITRRAILKQVRKEMYTLSSESETNVTD